MGARCKALCKKTRFHYGFVTNFSRRRYERADVDLNSTVAPDAMSRSFGAAQIIWRLEAGNAPRIDGRLAGEDSRHNEVRCAAHRVGDASLRVVRQCAGRHDVGGRGFLGLVME
jgi:hypothetical protein